MTSNAMKAPSVGQNAGVARCHEHEHKRCEKPAEFADEPADVMPG